MLLRFGPFELDPSLPELRRGGLALRLPPQPLRILLLLASRAGELVTREEIQRAIWGEATYVDFEQGINSAIRSIRSTLGDNSETARYVRTIPRRGYLFVATVERAARPGVVIAQAASAVAPPLPAFAPAPPPVAVRPRRQRFTFVLVAAIVATLTAGHASVPEPLPVAQAQQQLISIRPFRIIGGDHGKLDARVFEEELRVAVGALPARRVALVTGNAPATLFVEATIQPAAKSIRVITSLIDAKTRLQVWSETLERPCHRAEGLPIETAHLVSHELAKRFLPPSRREPRLVTRVSPRARALYRKGRIERARGHVGRAVTLLEEALREEPEFAEAQSGLADIAGTRALTAESAEVRANAALRATVLARRALALQPSNAEARTVLGVLTAQREYDLAAAEEMLRRALDDDPDYLDARFSMAMVLGMRGIFEEAFTELAAARELDPRRYDLHPSLPLIFLWARRYEDAHARYREILAVRPDSVPARWGLLTAFIAYKRWNDATLLAKQLRGETIPKEGLPVADEATFRAEYRLLEPLMQRFVREGNATNYAMAMYYAQLGEPDRAMDWLERTIADRSPMVSHLLVDPRFDSLRRESRFQALLSATKLRRRG